MSVYFYTGKPRGGKTHLAVETILAEMLKPLEKRRAVVTNIRLDLDYLVEVMHNEGVDIGQIDEQVRILTDEETGEFWTCVPGHDLTDRTQTKVNRRGGILDAPDLHLVGEWFPNGILYVIDECHIFYPAREWQKTGSDCTYYLSQHGKLKHDVILVTQHPDQCDKALRRLAQEYAAVRNLSREPVLGFRVGNVFRVLRMFNSPTSPNPQIFESAFKRLNKDVCKLYDTTQGVGIVGGLMPTNERKGRSLWWLAIPICGVGLLLWNMGAIGVWLGHTSAKFMRSKMDSVLTNNVMQFKLGSSNAPLTVRRTTESNLNGVPQAAIEGVSRAASAGGSGSLLSLGASPVNAGLSYPVATPPLMASWSPMVATQIVVERFELFLTGTKGGPDWVAQLSDGRILTKENSDLTKYSPRGLWISGRFYPKALRNPLVESPIDTTPAALLPSPSSAASDLTPATKTESGSR